MQILGHITLILEEFSEILPKDLLDKLPPMRDIQHTIDLVLGATLSNLPHYRMNPIEHAKLQRQVEELLDKSSSSPCAVPALLMPKKNSTWRMCMDSHAINKITVKCHFSIPCLDDMLDLMTSTIIFFKIDLKSEYHQIQIRTGDDERLHLKLRTIYMNGWLCILDCPMLLAPSRE